MKSAICLLPFAVLCCPPAAHAQTGTDGFQLGVGLRRTGSTTLGSIDANETTGSGGSFALFASETRLEGANGVDARVGIRLVSTLRAEASASYATSALSTRLASDVEGIPDATATEPVQQYTIEGALVVALPRWRIGARTTPFVSAGGGYARYRHERRTLVESGGLWHAGGGADITLASRPAGRVKTFGVRVDGRVLFRVGGVPFDDGAHAVPVLGASAFVGF